MSLFGLSLVADLLPFFDGQSTIEISPIKRDRLKHDRECPLWGIYPLRNLLLKRVNWELLTISSWSMISFATVTAMSRRPSFTWLPSDGMNLRVRAWLHDYTSCHGGEVTNHYIISTIFCIGSRYFQSEWSDLVFTNWQIKGLTWRSYCISFRIHDLLENGNSSLNSNHSNEEIQSNAHPKFDHCWKICNVFPFCCCETVAFHGFQVATRRAMLDLTVLLWTVFCW